MRVILDGSRELDRPMTSACRASARSASASYDLTVNKLVSHPLEDELGFALEQTVRLAFVAEFGFRMEPGLVSWPGG